MQRLLKQQRTDSSGNQQEDSSMSLGERLRGHEFVGLHHLEMRKMLPDNKYASDESDSDASQLIKIRNTII